ncbi:MAG: hypothetical protein HWN67_10665 [Candidatus Helarchaeota archaeon]|nr:hypothetical protein [Candidatus Helarchaeota archaeon]
MSINERVFNNRIAIILIIALIANTIFPAIGHLLVLHFAVIEWLIMNICSPTMIATTIGLILYLYKPRKAVAYYLIAVSILLFTFAIGGFFVPIPFSIAMIQAHISHVLMIITGIYIFYFVYKDETENDTKSLMLKGILPGLIIVLIINFVVFPLFFSANPNIWSKYYRFP